MTPTEVLANLEQVVKMFAVNTKGWQLKDAVYDGDNDSAELVLVARGPAGEHEEFIISSRHVRKLEDEETEEEPASEQSYSDIARDGRFH